MVPPVRIDQSRGQLLLAEAKCRAFPQILYDGLTAEDREDAEQRTRSELRSCSASLHTVSMPEFANNKRNEKLRRLRLYCAETPKFDFEAH